MIRIGRHSATPGYRHAEIALSSADIHGLRYHGERLRSEGQMDALEPIYTTIVV